MNIKIWVLFGTFKRRGCYSASAVFYANVRRIFLAGGTSWPGFKGKLLTNRENNWSETFSLSHLAVLLKWSNKSQSHCFPGGKYLILVVEVQTHDLPNRKGILTIKPWRSVQWEGRMGMYGELRWNKRKRSWPSSRWNPDIFVEKSRKVTVNCCNEISQVGLCCMQLVYLRVGMPSIKWLQTEWRVLAYRQS
jgi:hypothetical protein